VATYFAKKEGKPLPAFVPNPLLAPVPMAEPDVIAEGR